MAKRPVVAYDASGYAGMLIMDWLIDQQPPFTAVARNTKRVREMMAQRVVRLESKDHPLAAAGIGQLFELVTQLRGEAGARQAGEFATTHFGFATIFRMSL